MDSAATQFVQYTNDAVEVWYASGAHLQLSACGSAFMHRDGRIAGQHPLQDSPAIQQRTQFATSTFKDKVIEALDFRNRFADCPYLCRSLLDSALLMKLHVDIFEVGWPTVVRETHISVLLDGSIKLTSLDAFATLCLAPSRQYVTVQYLAKLGWMQARAKGAGAVHVSALPATLQTSAPGVESSLVMDSQTSQAQDIAGQDDGPESGTAATILSGGRWDYARATQHHSIQNCPDTWKKPLSLLLQYIHEHPEKISSMQKEGKAELVRPPDPKLLAKLSMKKCTFCSVPQTLPLNCQAVHLHKWKSEPAVYERDPGKQLMESAYLHGKLKVVCMHGVIYRLLWHNPRAVEIYPGDGSVLRSTGLVGHYFTHWVLAGDEVEERMYSIQCLPPHVPGAKYSVAKLIERGARFLSLLQDEHTQLLVKEDDCCWKTSSSPIHAVAPLPTVLLEECTVGSVGRFTAYSSGRVRVVFADRVCLDMQADFSHRLDNCRQHSQQGLDERSTITSRDVKGGRPSLPHTDLSQTTCRLLLPNGHYQNVLIGNPQGFQKTDRRHHIRPVIQQLHWLPVEQHVCYKLLLHVYHTLNGLAPAYITELLQEHIPCKALRFPFWSPVLWNALPVYTQAALEWVAWVNTLPSQRCHFYKDTIHDQHRKSSVDVELQKINCFNYIIEHTVMPQFRTLDLSTAPGCTATDLDDNSNTQNMTPNTMEATGLSGSSYRGSTTHHDSVAGIDYSMVQQALSNTAKHLQSLEKFLGMNGEQRPVRD